MQGNQQIFRGILVRVTDSIRPIRSRLVIALKPTSRWLSVWSNDLLTQLESGVKTQYKRSHQGSAIHYPEYGRETPLPTVSKHTDIAEHWQVWKELFHQFNSLAISTHTIQVKIQPLTAQSIGIKERLEAIQQTFGLTLAPLAKLLNISRATLYTWFDHDINLKAIGRKALERLEHRAGLWTEMCAYAPGTLLRSREVNGKTLEAWLMDPNVNDDQLRFVMKEFAQRVNQRERKLAAVTVRPSIPASDDLRSIE
jgi:DNA-binding transcriptional regulator YiaG